MSADRIPASGGSRRSSHRPPGLTLPIPPREEPFAYNAVPVPLPLPLPPAELSPSELEKLGILGYGSQGKVYKARHRATETLYALKVVHGNHDLSTRRQIVREMDILRKTDSRYVVKCHGVYDRGGEIQFVLEYTDEGSLEKCGRMPEPFLAAVARQVLHCLEYIRSSALRSCSVGQGSK